MRSPCLVYLETSGNQSFIFGTNKLREIIGASEAISQVGTVLVARAVNRVFGAGAPEQPAEGLQDWICRQPPIEDGGPGVEIVIATSGKAVLLVRTEEQARELITAWSLSVAKETPGVDATGVFSGPFSMADPGALGAAMKQVHRRFDEARVLRTAPEARHQLLPIVEPCRTSGLPAAGFYEEYRREAGRERPPRVPGSAVTLAKRRKYHEARGRFLTLFHDPDQERDVDLHPVFNLDRLAEEWDMGWLAVVHADGNGLGQLFLDFECHVTALEGRATGRSYVRHYRAFSQDLDAATCAAFRAAALHSFPEVKERSADRWSLPIVPLIVGGDDLTVVCDGQRALAFTLEFLRAFEAELGDPRRPAAQIAREAFGASRIGMCAGVAIIKPSFPFHSAYDLAGQLIKEAKQVKQRVTRGGDLHPTSALDFHLVYDSSLADLGEIRERLRRPDRRLYARPFVTTRPGSPHPDREGAAWCEHHHVDRLIRAIDALRCPAKGDRTRRALPAARAHAIREALHDSRAAAEEALALARARHQADGFSWPEEGLFVEEPVTGLRTTVFQDALEALDFSKGIAS